MSVYSGFSTRTQEAQYYKSVEGLLYLLQSRVLISLKTDPKAEDHSWLKKFNNTYNNMKNLEFHKYLEPKLTESCRELASYFSIDIPADPIYSELSYPRQFQSKVENSIKQIRTPRKKEFLPKVRNKTQRETKNNRLGMSQYYGKVMDNFLAQPKSRSHKKNKGSVSLDTQDFWLLDDKIKVIESSMGY